MPETPPPAPPRPVRLAVPVLLLLAAGSLAAAVLLPVPRRKPTAETAAELPPRDVPAFAMTNRDGTPVTNETLKGKVWVASFVFTRCDQTCPLVAGTMHRLQTALDLAGRPDLRFVTFSMDPEYDTPDVLQRYAADPAHPAATDRWLFLSGTEADVQRLMKIGFLLAFERNEKAAAVGQKYNHGTYLYLVDKRGQIRGYYPGIQGAGDPTGENYRESLDRLARDAAKLLGE